MYSSVELAILAQQYISETGVAASTLSRYVTGHTKLFDRLLSGFDCLMRVGEQASIWFDLNWPTDVPWPAGMRPRGSALASMQPRSPVLPARRTLRVPDRSQTIAF